MIASSAHYANRLIKAFDHAVIKPSYQLLSAKLLEMSRTQDCS